MSKPAQLPRQVKINHRLYEIKLEAKNDVLDDDHKPVMGKFGYTEKQIILSDGYGDMADTLLHEIIHAIDRATGKMTLKERQVDYLAAGILGVLQDNPEVLAYLLEDK